MIKKQKIKVYTARSGASWHSTATQAANWVNKNINPAMVKSITTVLCHWDKTGMVNIFYDNLEQDVNKYYGLNSTHLLVFHTLRQNGTGHWDSHNEKVCKMVGDIEKESGKIVGVNNLEVNDTHQEMLSIIWSLQQKVV